nr:hypothetical protein BaRGS_011759 [Batillaria attramentaria]
MEPDEQAAAPAEASASEPKRSEFAAVVFDQTAETYPEDANVECCYTLTTDIKPSSRDWIGLFKVGWLSPRDYLYYEWAALPPQYEAGKEAEAKVVFPAARLPKDDAEFYQFCYVSSTSSIRGASTPFQFKRPSADDFVELDDPDEEMRIILPMSSHLTQQVTKYKMLASSLEAERDRLSAKLSKAHSKAEQCSNEASKLRRKLDDSTAALRDMTMAHDEVKSRLEMFEKERERLDDQVLQEEQKVAQCLETIRALEAERDELAGHCSSLKSEVSTYRNTILDLESQVRSATTQLQQTEDQLQATQERKVMMEREMEAYREAQAKLSNDLEIAFGQNHAFKEQMQQMEVGFSDEMKLMRNEQLQKDHDIEALRQKLELVEQEKFALRKQLDDVERSAYVSQEAAASLFALQKANDALKARHDKMSSALEEKEKELATLKRQSRHKERELYRAAEDDRQRVEMCKAEYKMSGKQHKVLCTLWHKKDKYKRLYLEEKEKGDMLRCQYDEEIQKKDF